VINEIQSANTKTVVDEDNDYSDWLELYNAGGVAVNLGGYGLSDDLTQPLKWKLPSVTLQPGERLIVFCSGKNRKPIVDHWETAVYSNEIWKYIVPSSEPDPAWRGLGFNDASWLNGAGGIGYGDGDDLTTIPNALSVYMRYQFNIADTSKILQAILSADYDDAFVAYINGVEVARNGIGSPGIPPAYNQHADILHEAGLYWGLPPESYTIDKQTLSQILVEGNNVLAIQTHNEDISSSDLSSNYFFSVGINDNSFTYGVPPGWFPQEQVQLHTNFKISSVTGETISLADASGSILDQKQISYLTADLSLQRSTDGAATWCISSSPTPNDVNASANCYDGYLVQPTYSLQSGFYNGTQTITIFNNNFNSETRYTIDGSIPIVTSSLYTSPVTLNSTTVIKARAFPTSGNFLPSNTAVNTYFIDEPMTTAVISISTNPSFLWDVDSGMYVFGDSYYPAFPYYGANFWDPFEYPGYVEYFDINGNQQFETPMGLQLQGNWSKGFPQKSFQLRMHDYLGGSTVHYQLFPDKNITSFDNFNLRNGGIDWNTVGFRDDLMERMCRYTNLDIMDSHFAVVFLNGYYWGIYEVREREDEGYLQNNHGVDPTKVDIVRYDGDVMAGTADDFWAMNTFITNNDMADSANFETAKNWLDVDNYADYFIAETYYANTDWVGDYSNNIKYWRVNDPPGKWRYILWDTDGGLGLFSWAGYDLLYTVLHPSNYNEHCLQFASMLNNPGYKKYFINRYADLMNTIFTPASLTNTAWEMRDSINAELPRHLDRWGELNPDWYGWGTSVDMTSYGENFNHMIAFINNRPGYQRDFVQSDFSLQGQNNITLQTSPVGAGLIKISTIIPDVLPWTGVYFYGNPVKVTAIPNAGFTFDHWNPNSIIPLTYEQAIEFDPSSSTTFTAVFTGTAENTQLDVSEIMYNPDSTMGGGDWFELHNYGSTALDVSDWKVKDSEWYHEFKIPTGTVIPADDYLVLADDINSFQQAYPDVVNVIGSMNFGLNNNSDVIELYDAKNQLYSSLTYHDTLPWRKCADGWGRSLELAANGADENDPASWFDGCTGGSPGISYSPCPQQIVFGEINYHPDLNFDSGDWIELYNYGSSPIDISNWKFCDDHFGDAFSIPSGTVLGPDERLVLYNDLTKFSSLFPNVTNMNGPFAFGLDAHGEPLRLFDENGKLYNSIVYDDHAPWTPDADGGGYTLELSDPLGPLCDGNNYFAGCYGGSPGLPYTPCNVVVNDVKDFSCSVYPNPSAEFFMVEIHGAPAEVLFELHDVSGKKVLERRLKNEAMKIDVHELPKGIYWYYVIGDKEILKRGKLIAQ